MKAVILSIILLPGILIAADYQGWLGTKTEPEFDYLSVDFEAVDDLNGDAIIDFFIHCTSRGNRNACSIDQGMKTIMREVKFRVVKQVNKTWLFTKGESIVGEDDVEVRMMFIHPDYERLNVFYMMKELLSMQDEVVLIKLKRSSE